MCNYCVHLHENEGILYYWNTRLFRKDLVFICSFYCTHSAHSIFSKVTENRNKVAKM
jgi:hypothetical protein